MGETCSVCGTAVSGSDVLYAPDGSIVCPTHFAALEPVVDSGGSSWRMAAIAGAIVGAIPFLVHASTSSVTMFNGEVTSFVYRDWIAVIGGFIAATLGLLALVAARRAKRQRALAFAAGAAVLVLGVGQIARGFGVFASPGHADSSSSFSITTGS